ncbi:hypothetical protein VN97_g7397 [Penicillium thymicola]|uniref:Uncharacterized protein n=1 Tax=Penicillium thymicola TaxID=293382 RepID=A0AAI9TF81_PENTH|nr:hypothetical protein VN97_g7397 [Penicillium thymicola]
MMLRNSRLVWYPCKNCISVIEGDLQNTVKAPLGEFCDRGHAIGVSIDRVTGRPNKSIYVKLNTAFNATELFVKSILTQQVSLSQLTRSAATRCHDSQKAPRGIVEQIRITPHRGYPPR